MEKRRSGRVVSLLCWWVGARTNERRIRSTRTRRTNPLNSFAAAGRACALRQPQPSWWARGQNGVGDGEELDSDFYCSHSGRNGTAHFCGGDCGEKRHSPAPLCGFRINRVMATKFLLNDFFLFFFEKKKCYSSFVIVCFGRKQQAVWSAGHVLFILLPLLFSLAVPVARFSSVKKILKFLFNVSNEWFEQHILKQSTWVTSFSLLNEVKVRSVECQNHALGS